MQVTFLTGLRPETEAGYESICLLFDGYLIQQRRDTTYRGCSRIAYIMYGLRTIGPFYSIPSSRGVRWGEVRGIADPPSAPTQRQGVQMAFSRAHVTSSETGGDGGCSQTARACPTTWRRRRRICGPPAGRRRRRRRRQVRGGRWAGRRTTAPPGGRPAFGRPGGRRGR